MSNYGKVHANYDTVVDALRAHADEVFEEVADLIVMLGAVREWSMEQNFTTTESIAALASTVGLHGAGDQTDKAGRFYAAAASALGYDADDWEGVTTCAHCGEEIAQTNLDNGMGTVWIGDAGAMYCNDDDSGQRHEPRD